MELTVYSVKEFNELVNTVLAEHIGEVMISGEVSGYQVRQNKWVSFDLKDKESVVNCFMPLHQLDLPLDDGQEIIVSGTPRIYVPYGKYSLNVRSVQLKGEGALKKAFEALKAKLADEGLFDPVHKRALPRFPETIGIITSAEGAAVNDIVKVINRRWGGLTLHLAPVLVQGANAPDQLVGAIQYFNQHHPVDIIIFGRGGGSLEDLQAFNSERVARAIFSSRIPIITGIGHEHNTSIADLVADRRAATPSNAAEIAVPDRETVRREVDLLRHRGEQLVIRKVMLARERVGKHLRTLQFYVSSRMSEIRLLIQTLQQKFTDSIKRVAYQQEQVSAFTRRLKTSVTYKFETAQSRLREGAKLMAALNPTAILQRGYSITYQISSGKPIIYLADLPHDGKIKTQISNGSFEATLTEQRSGNRTEQQITTVSVTLPNKKPSAYAQSDDEKQSKLF